KARSFSWGAWRRPAGAAVSGACLEAVADADGGDPGVDVGLADVLAVQANGGRDVDVAQIGIQEPAVAELEVGADLGGDTPGIAQAEVAAGQRALAFGAEEGRVVQPHAHVGLEGGVR